MSPRAVASSKQTTCKGGDGGAGEAGKLWWRSLELPGRGDTTWMVGCRGVVCSLFKNLLGGSTRASRFQATKWKKELLKEGRGRGARLEGSRRLRGATLMWGPSGSPTLQGNPTT